MFERVFAYYIISMGVQLAANIVLNIPLKFIFPNYSDLGEFFVAIIACLICMFLLCFRDGYKLRVFEFKEFLICAAIMLCLLLVVIYFTGHIIYISGPTDHLERYILYEVNPSLINGAGMLDKYSWYLMMGAFAVLYVPVMTFGMYLGNKKRKKQFDEYKK